MNKEHIIKVPHLKNYVIVVKKKKKDDIPDAAAYSKRVCAEESLLVVPMPIKGKVSAGHLVHEIIHILQYICEDHNMSFTYEREHMAYIAGYIFEEVCKM